MCCNKASMTPCNILVRHNNFLITVLICTVQASMHLVQDYCCILFCPNVAECNRGLTTSAKLVCAVLKSCFEADFTATSSERSVLIQSTWRLIWKGKRPSSAWQFSQWSILSTKVKFFRKIQVWKRHRFHFY